MKCEQCGNDAETITYSEFYDGSRCGGCYMNMRSPTHLEVQAVSTPNCTGEITVSTPTFDQASEQLRRAAQMMAVDYYWGTNQDYILGEDVDPIPLARQRTADWVMVINKGQRSKIRERFNQQRAALKLKDAEILQLRERLDRAKRGS